MTRPGGGGGNGIDPPLLFLKSSVKNIAYRSIRRSSSGQSDGSHFLIDPSDYTEIGQTYRHRPIEGQAALIVWMFSLP
jgi:hypothetical protein